MAKKLVTRSAMLVSGRADDDPNADWKSIAKRLKGVIESTARSHPKGLDIICGMRPGAELVAGRAALAAKQSGYDVRVIAYEKYPGQAQELRDEAASNLRPDAKIRFANMSDYVRANADDFVQWERNPADRQTDFEALLIVGDATDAPNARHEAVRDGKPVFKMDIDSPEMSISALEKKTPTKHVHIENVPKALICETDADAPTVRMSLADADGTLGNGRDTFRVELDRDAVTFDEATRRYTIDADVAALVAYPSDDTRDGATTWSVRPEAIGECLPATLEAMSERTAVIRAARAQESLAERNADKARGMDSYSTSEEPVPLDELISVADEVRAFAEGVRSETSEDMRDRLKALDGHDDLRISTSVGNVSLKERTDEIVEELQSKTQGWNEMRDGVFENLTAAASSIFLKKTVEAQTLAATLDPTLENQAGRPESEQERKLVASKVLDNCSELSTLLMTKGLVPYADGTTEPESPTMRIAYETTFPDPNVSPERLHEALAFMGAQAEEVYGVFDDIEDEATDVVESQAETTEAQEAETVDATELETVDAAETTAEVDERTVERQTKEMWDERQAEESEESTYDEVVARGRASLQVEDYKSRERSVRIEPTLWKDADGNRTLGGSQIFVDDEPVSLPNDSRMCDLEPYETLIPTSADRDVVDYLARNDLIVAESMVGKATVRAAINLERLMQQENSGVERMLDIAQEVEDQRSASTQMTSPQRQEQTEKSTEALHESTPQAATTQDTHDITDN